MGSIGSLAVTVPRAVREKNSIVDAILHGLLAGYFNVETIHTASCLTRSTDDMTAFTLYSAFTLAFMNQLLAFL